MHLEQYADAAEHYAYYLREAPADRKQKAQAVFEKARAKVGSVSVKVDRTGVEVLVDGVAAGRSPLAEPVFVMPGKHSFQMRLGNQVLAEQAIETAAGGSYDVTLAMKPAGEKPLQSELAAAKQTDSKQAAPVQPQPPPEVSKLPVRTIVIGAGAGTTAVLIGTGIGLAVASSQKGADVSTRLDALEKQSGPSPCFVPWRNVSACDEVVKLSDEQSRFTNGAIWTFIAGGVVGAGTLAYTLVTRKKPESSAVQVHPVVGAGSTAVVVRGQW